MDDSYITAEEALLIDFLFRLFLLTGRTPIDEGKCEHCGQNVISFQVDQIHSICLSNGATLKLKGMIYEEGKRTITQRKEGERDSG